MDQATEYHGSRDGTACDRSPSRKAAACRDGRLRLVDSDTVKIVADQPGVTGWAYSLAITPDGSHAAIAGANGQIHRVALTRRGSQ